MHIGHQARGCWSLAIVDANACASIQLQDAAGALAGCVSLPAREEKRPKASDSSVSAISDVLYITYLLNLLSLTSIGVIGVLYTLYGVLPFRCALPKRFTTKPFSINRSMRCHAEG